MDVWLVSDVDTEFDYLRPGYKGNWKKENPGLTIGVPKLIEFFRKWNLKATFHIQEQKDPEHSILLRYSQVYGAVEEAGFEISLHSHIMEENYDIRKKEISAGVERLSENGYRVESFRAGWYFTNENSVRVLEELGLKFDCSPYKNLPVGPMNWAKIPNSPYHPSRKDITKIGNSNILIVPITDFRLGISIHTPNEKEFKLMKKGVEALVDAAESINRPVLLFFTTHSWKPLELNSEKLREWEVNRREDFFDFLSQYTYKTLTVGEAGELWEKKEYKPYYLDLPDYFGPTLKSYHPSHYSWMNKSIVPRIRKIKYKFSGKL